MIQNIYLYFSKTCDANLWWWALSGCLFKNVCTAQSPLPARALRGFFSWICYEMLVDKYENMNIENIYSILLYELTHLICWLKAYSSKLHCAHWMYVLGTLLQRSSLRKHSATSRLHKHACIAKIRCSCAFLCNFKTCTHCLHQNPHVLWEWKCTEL